MALGNPYRNLQWIFAKRKIYLTAFLDYVGSQERDACLALSSAPIEDRLHQYVREFLPLLCN